MPQSIYYTALSFLKYKSNRVIAFLKSLQWFPSSLENIQILTAVEMNDTVIQTLPFCRPVFCLVLPHSGLPGWSIAFQGRNYGFDPWTKIPHATQNSQNQKVPRSNRLQGLCVSTPCPQSARRPSACKSGAVLPPGHLQCRVLREALPGHLGWGWAVPISQGVPPTLSWWTPHITLGAARTVRLYTVCLPQLEGKLQEDRASGCLTQQCIPTFSIVPSTELLLSKFLDWVSSRLES